MSNNTTDLIFPTDIVPSESGTVKHPTGFWQHFDSRYLRHSPIVTIALVVLFTLIFTTGVLGNSAVILVVAKLKQMQTVTNIFIMSLSVADLLVILCCVPATLCANLFQPWILGWAACRVVPFIQSLSVGASAYSLVLVSFERFRAVHWPLKHRMGLSSFQVSSCILFTWIMAILLSLPIAQSFDLVTLPADGLSYCVETWKHEDYGNMYYLFVNLTCFYVIPFIVILGSNAGVWWKVSHRHAHDLSSRWNNATEVHRRTRHCVRTKLSIVTITYMLSWLPLHILVIEMRFVQTKTETGRFLVETLLPFTQLLGSWNSCINPVFYAFWNKTFRESLQDLLPPWRRFPSSAKTASRNSCATGRIKLGRTGSTVCNEACMQDLDICYQWKKNNQQHRGSDDLSGRTLSIDYIHLPKTYDCEVIRASDNIEMSYLPNSHFAMHPESMFQTQTSQL